MFTHNLASQINALNHEPKRWLWMLLALVLVLFAIAQWYLVELKTEETFIENYLIHSQQAAKQKPIITQEMTDDCEKHQINLQLLGVLISEAQIITLVKNKLTGQIEIISNSNSNLNGLYLVSAKLKQAVYQIGKCRFILSLTANLQGK